MFTKRACIVFLAGVNLLLFAMLLSGVVSLPKAFAQRATGAGGSFLTVTAKPSGQTYDVLYALDSADHKLHALFPGDMRSRKLSYGGFRDLARDFSRD